MRQPTPTPTFHASSARQSTLAPPAGSAGPTPLDALLAVHATQAPHRKGELHRTTASVLRNMIITGVLAPGERLNERELCERLRVSRTPVREAIKTLTQEGLLQSLPNRSPVVAPLDATQTSALIDVVSTIEGLAGELAAKRISDAQVAELGILHYTMLRHHAHDELPGYFEANKAFHRRIVECADNPVLLWVWDLLALRVDRARYASNLWPTRWQKAIDEHAAILDRLAARDADAVSQRMRQHVRNGLSLAVAAADEEQLALAAPGGKVPTSPSQGRETSA
ncbi:MAG: GntR family transcriptional regulator [Lautropia sp.]|nr:GntR family transcriptional regulator [Lautropia sp.]